ncbi:hypothetical protein [Burkholderia pseudomallei]|uniref:hypothetical protein n=1 Tax=Burkholderia pseudomallei TaxID=28450 RepID=UPI001AAFA940|nr:hypothetical protein [Burkholderia pseudomallei]MBO2954793.1 hypothetical protein [Burkholderia pseudomallei]
MPLLKREENSSRKRTSISKNNRKFFRRNAAFFRMFSRINRLDRQPEDRKIAAGALRGAVTTS